MVGKIAFLFPGQGSQYVGMGKKAWETSTKAQYLFEKSDRIMGFSLSTIMFEGPEEKLKETSITQPALFLASAAALELLKDKGIKPAFSAGHSLGEYSALYSVGALSFDQALTLVHERGKAMQEAGLANPGTMAAILGLAYDKLNAICQEVSKEFGPVVPANYNSENQIVISGAKEAVNKAMALCSQAGALKVIELNVSGAFHSPLMEPAVLRMRPLIEEAPFTTSDNPVITNVDAEATSSPEEFRQKLIAQIDHGVRWFESMKKLLDGGVDTFIEVGAGRVLSTLIKKMDRTKAVYSTEEFDAIEKNFSTLHAL